MLRCGRWCWIVGLAVATLNAPSSWANNAPVVSNVTAAQRQDGSKKVDIYYRLVDADGDDCMISLQSSNDGGATWTVPITAVSGHVGPGITPGVNRHIVWDCAGDLPGTCGSQYKVRVCADDGHALSGMTMIPAGEFQMGNSFTGEGNSDELPPHAVYIDGFYMDTYEVTNQQYCEALNWAWAQGNLIQVENGKVYKYGGTSYRYCHTRTYDPLSRITWNGSTFGVVAGKANHPMVTASWYGSVAYCNWRSGMQGKPLCYDLSTWTCDFGSGYRLPTEAEWEKAARGGTPGHRFPWSDQDTIQHVRCNYWSSSTYAYDTSPTRGYHPLWGVGAQPYTSPVGFFNGSLRNKADFNWPGSPTSYQTANGASGYGLHDMAGNVWEWCNDWYESNYYNGSQYDNPRGPTSGTHRVLRGGSWVSVGALVGRVASRDHGAPTYVDQYVGFRCALASSAVRESDCENSTAFTIDNRPGTDLDLFVQSVHMTQAIQDGNIPMIADRPTFLRVLVGWSGTHSQVVGVDARLAVSVNGSPIAGSPFASLNGPITAVLQPNLVNENDTLNFRFVAPQSDDADLTVELNPQGPGRVPETNYANNTHELANQSFLCRRAMTIQYIPIDYRFGLNPFDPPNLPNAAMIAPGSGNSLVQAVYPSPNCSYAAAGSIPWPFDISTMYGAGAWYFLCVMENARLLMSPRPDFMYAWFPASAFTGDFIGASTPGGHAALGTDDSDYRRRVFAHELGHNFGLNHPGGGSPAGDSLLREVGIDVDNLVGLGLIKDPYMFGIMYTGAPTSVTWVDSTSYRFFIASDRLSCHGFRGSGSILLVTGLFDPVSTTATIYAVHEFAEGELTPPNANGNLMLRAFNLQEGEHLVYELPFAASGTDCGSENPCIAPIVISIPTMPADPCQQVDRIDLLLSATSQLLAQRWRSQSPPEAAILTPSPGAVLSDGTEVSWAGSDPDGDTIHWALTYSWNNGVSWVPIVADTTGTSAIINAIQLPGSNPGRARLRLTATDGFNTVSCEVANLTLAAKKPPTVLITAPAENAVALEVAAVVLAASVSDPEDGQLTSESISWFSDVDGFVGAGESLVATSLSLGFHVLTVVATDSDQMTGVDSVSIEIVARQPGSIAGDFDHDGIVGFSDFENLARCFAGPDNTLMGSCTEFNPDLAGDSDADLADFALFQTLFGAAP